MSQIQFSLVGRDNDVRALADALRPADPAQTLLVTGPAGVGKTAVLESGRQAAVRDGAKVLRLGWESAEGEPGVPALADALCRVLTRIHDGRLPARITDIRRAQLRTAGTDGDLTVLATLGRVLADAAHYVPFALVVDDAERMPSATASAFGLMLRAFRPAGMPVVMVRRSVAPSRTGAELPAAADRVLDLAPLGPTDVQTLVEQRFGRPTDPEVAQAVTRSLGPLRGNPRAVLSVLGALEEDGGVRELDGCVHLASPEDALRLGGTAAELRGVAWPSLQPGQAQLESVAELAHLIAAMDLRLSDVHSMARGAPRRFIAAARIVDGLVTDGVLVVGPAHNLLFAVPAFGTALRKLPIRSQLPELHVLIAVVAASQLSPAIAGARQPRLAEHAAAAGAVVGDEVTVPLLVAAARNHHGNAQDRAAGGCVAALRHLPLRYPGRARVLRTAAELCLRHTDYTAILALGEPLSASIDARRPTERADLEIAARAWGLAALYEHLPLGAGVERTWAAVLRMPAGPELAALGGRYGIGPVVPAPDGDGSVDVDVDVDGDTVDSGGSPGDRPSGSAVAGAEVPDHGSYGVRAPAEGPYGVDGLLPSPAQFRLLAAAVGGPAGLEAAPGDLAACALGDTAVDAMGAAAAYGDLAGAMACVLGGPYPMAGDSVAARYSTMVRAYLAGDWAQALSCARRIEARGRARDVPGASQLVRVLAAEIHLASGEPGRAQAWMGTVPDGFVHPLAGQVRVGVRYMSGRTDEAYEGGWRDVRRARESGLLEGSDRLLLRIFQYGTYDDLPQVTQRAVAELGALYEESASPRTGELLHLARAVLNRDLDAVTATFHLVRERGDRPLALTCHEWLAMLSDDPAPWLSAAIREAHTLGVRHIERTVFGRRARMYGLQLPLPRRRQAKEGFSELDLRLVGLVGAGATNRQIAIRLACSEKTVEQHLTRLFRLTGCRSRAELAAARLDGSLARLGLPPDTLTRP